jgi:putative transposase
LSENVIAVGDALRHAVGNDGIPAIIYSDNGAGETAKQLDCPVTGIIARLGAEHHTGIPGNPQARGLIERSWPTWAIKCARQFGSYQGKDVDSGTLRKVASELAKEQRALKRAEATGEVIQLSNKAPSWKQFIDAVDRAVREYNATHRHRSLPKHTSGPHAGKHMTPDEAWAAMLDTEHQHMLSPLDLRMLFMPAQLRTAKRGEVQFFNQVYANAELMAVDGQQVRVHYDIHDPSYVMVYTIDGRVRVPGRLEREQEGILRQARRADGAREARRSQDETPAGRDGAGRARAASHARCRQCVFPAGAGTPAVLVPPVEAFDSSSPSLCCPTGAAGASRCGQAFLRERFGSLRVADAAPQRLGR